MQNLELKHPPQAILLDLGNVVLGVDFRKVFDYWAQAANVDVAQFHSRWEMDEPYCQHETGEISFATYASHLSSHFEVEMPLSQWQQGWNNIWTEPLHDVIVLLPQICQHYPLYCFTNTNDVHTVYWRKHYADAISHFKHVFVSSEIGMRKPEIPAYQHVCQAIAVPPEQVVFLDDNKDNFFGAQAAGLQALHTPKQQDVVRGLQQCLALV